MRNIRLTKRRIWWSLGKALGLIMMGTMSKGAATLIKQAYILPYLIIEVMLFVAVMPKYLQVNVKQWKAVCRPLAKIPLSATAKRPREPFSSLPFWRYL